jgi:tetratricopeptide (TPR) repeat protein
MSVLRHTLDDYKILYPELDYYCTRAISHALWTTLPSYGLELVSHHLGIPFTHHAVEEDAMACAAIDSYALMTGYAGIPPGDLRPKAQAAAERAVELDEQSGEAHTSRALVAQNYDWDWQTAEKEYRRAIELDPNYSTAHHWYAEYLAQMGRFDEALVESERARQLDPLSLIIAADNGVILYYSRQYDRAIEQFRAVLDMDPTFPRAHMVQAAYAQKGMYEESLAVIRKWHPGPGYWSNLAYDYGRSGRQAEAQHALQELQKLDRRQQVDPLAFCVAYVGMNNNNQALASLQKAYEEHSISLPSLKVDPIYDPLRSDPRFQDLLRRLGLAP